MTCLRLKETPSIIFINSYRFWDSHEEVTNTAHGWYFKITFKVMENWKETFNCRWKKGKFIAPWDLIGGLKRAFWGFVETATRPQPDSVTEEICKDSETWSL